MDKIIKTALIVIGMASFSVSASAEVYTWRAAAGTTQNWTNFDWSPASTWPTRALNLPGISDNAYIQGISWADDHVILDSTQVVGGVYVGYDWSTHIQTASLTITSTGNLSTDGSDGWNDGIQIGGQSPATITSAGTVNTTGGTTSGNLTLGARSGTGWVGGVLNLTGGSWTSAGIWFDPTTTNHIQIDGGTIQAWSIFNLASANQTIDITGGILKYHSADATWFDMIVATGNLTANGTIGDLVAVHSGTSWAITAFSEPAPLDTVKSIAHRGGALFAPENTCAAFGAFSNVADLVEFDIRVSLDGELVVMHDVTVDRTTDGTGDVSTLTLAQLKELDAGSWFSSFFADERIPTLVEAIQCILPAATPLIERKAGTPQSFVDTLQAMNATSNVVIQSFDWDFLESVHALDASIRLAALGSGVLTSNVVSDIQAKGIGTIAWAGIDITVTEVELIHTFGMELFVWTLNGPIVQNYINLGVDGVASDDPALVHNLGNNAPVANQILASELTTYWKFDDGLANDSSTDAVDVEASNHGFLGGFDIFPSWTVGADAQFDGAIFLDGIDDYVDIPQSESLDLGTNAVSISLWVKLPSKISNIPENYASIYDSDIDSYIVYLDRTTQELRFKVTDTVDQATRPGIPEGNIETGKWHHVTGIFNGAAGPISGQASIYLDGRLMDVHTVQGMVEEIKGGQHAAIGRNGTVNNSWFSGEIDDVAIWRRALSYGEVLQIFTSGSSSIPLQKSIMNIEITGLSFTPNPTNVLVDVQVAHALLTGNDLVLQGSTNVAGPYVTEGGSYVEDMGTNTYILSGPMDNSTAKFFRVINP